MRGGVSIPPSTTAVREVCASLLSSLTAHDVRLHRVLGVVTGAVVEVLALLTDNLHTKLILQVKPYTTLYYYDYRQIYNTTR